MDGLIIPRADLERIEAERRELAERLKTLCDCIWAATNDGNGEPVKRVLGLHAQEAYTEARITIATQEGHSHG